MRRRLAEDDRQAAELWFLGHGLPWFVDAEAERASRLLRSRPRRRVGVAVLALGAVVGGVAAWGAGSGSVGLSAGLTAVVVSVAAWAAVSLDLHEVAEWALRRTARQLGLLLPLATRALPLLLIFTVFFFINTEVWQVAAAMPPGVLWLSVLLFTALALLFLVARLPEEVQRVVEHVRRDGPGEALARTPLAGYAAELAAGVEVRLGRLQRANLLLMLLVVQAGQVLLLAVSVFAFFVVFGVLAIQPEIVVSWLGEPGRPVAGGGVNVTVELLQVSVFLAAFSGLYFTVSAVTDDTYRQQFFTQITRELTRAVAMRAAYVRLTADSGEAA